MKIVQITFDCPDDETYLQVLGISKSFKDNLSGFAEVNIKEVESTPAEDWVKVLQENLQAQIAGFYNHDKTPEEKKIRNAVIQEYKDLIAIFKHKFPLTT